MAIVPRTSTDLLSELNEKLALENQDLRARLKGAGGGSGGDLISYRLEQFEKRADKADARMSRVEDALASIQVVMAGLATRDTVRNWVLALSAIIVATGISVGAIVLQSLGNQLSAFQAGLSAIQAVAAGAQGQPPPPAKPAR